MFFFCFKVATALREMRRVDEEMKKREKILSVKTDELEKTSNPDALDNCER